MQPTTSTAKTKFLFHFSSCGVFLCTRLHDFYIAFLRCIFVRHRFYPVFSKIKGTLLLPFAGNWFVKVTSFAGFCGGGILFLSSCEKVIDINLNNGATKYVIEGMVTDEPGPAKVQITQTVNFSDKSIFPAVSGAIVTLQDNNNAAITLTETSAGMYESTVITGIAGHTYILSATINGVVFTAASTMPEKVIFDSLFVENFSGFGDPQKIANTVFADPAGKGNSYHFIQYKNGVRNKSIFIVNDEFTDGRVNTSVLLDFGNDDDDNKFKINTGDTVKVAMECVDAAVYKYWYSLNASGTGNTNNASPGNAVSNITGGALGYFSAHTVQSKTVISP